MKTDPRESLRIDERRWANTRARAATWWQDWKWMWWTLPTEGRDDGSTIDSMFQICTRVALGFLVAGLLFWVFGCASMNQKCSYYPDGIMESYRLRSTVIGTGETEMVSTDCAVAGYSTRDTGLSDNGRVALGEIAEKVVRGIVAGAVPLP